MRQPSPALILMDCQSNPCASRSFDAGDIARSAIPVMERLLSVFRSQGWTVLHCQDGVGHQDNGTFILPARPIVSLKPLASEPVVRRQVASAYAEPAFAQLIERQGAAPIILAGFSASTSILATVFDAIARDHRFLIVEEAIASWGLDPASAAITHQSALVLLRKLTRVCTWQDEQMEWLTRSSIPTFTNQDISL